MSLVTQWGIVLVLLSTPVIGWLSIPLALIVVITCELIAKQRAIKRGDIQGIPDPHD